MREKSLYLGNFCRGLKAPFGNYRAAAITILLSMVLYSLLTLAIFPGYSSQLLGASFFYLDQALVVLTLNAYETTGLLGVAVTFLYGFFSAVALVNIWKLVRSKGFGNVMNLGLVVPGALASGCAACGVGLLGLLGLAGAVSLFPFQGTLVRVAGISLVVLFLARTGDPETCSV